MATSQRYHEPKDWQLGEGRERRKGDRDEGRGKGIEIQGERGTQSLWTGLTLHSLHIDLAEAR